MKSGTKDRIEWGKVQPNEQKIITLKFLKERQKSSLNPPTKSFINTEKA